jgi:hypothetical protein
MKQHKCWNESRPTPDLYTDGEDWYIPLEMGPLWVDFCPFCGVRLASQTNVGSEATVGVTPVMRSLPSDEEIGKVVERIAYKQLHEDHGDDFLEKVWILKNFLIARQ